MNKINEKKNNNGTNFIKLFLFLNIIFFYLDIFTLTILKHIILL